MSMWFVWVACRHFCPLPRSAKTVLVCTLALHPGTDRVSPRHLAVHTMSSNPNALASSFTRDVIPTHKHLSLIVQHLNIHPTFTKRNIKTQAAAHSNSKVSNFEFDQSSKIGNAPPFRRSSSCAPRRPVIWEHPSRGLGQGYVGTRCRGRDRHSRAC
jgi:hypothetical protein